MSQSTPAISSISSSSTAIGYSHNKIDKLIYANQLSAKLMLSIGRLLTLKLSYLCPAESASAATASRPLSPLSLSLSTQNFICCRHYGCLFATSIRLFIYRHLCIAEHFDMSSFAYHHKRLFCNTTTTTNNNNNNYHHNRQQPLHAFKKYFDKSKNVTLLPRLSPSRLDTLIGLVIIMLQLLLSQLVTSTSFSSISTMPNNDTISSKYFKIKPSDTHVVEGENVELKCQISLEFCNACSVQWAKDGFLLGYEPIIPGYDRYIMTVNKTTRTYNLQIFNAQLEDEAEFECQMSGSEVTSATTKQPIRAAAYLHLIVPPKTIVINSSRSFDNQSPSVYRSYQNASSSSEFSYNFEQLSIVNSNDSSAGVAGQFQTNRPNTFTVEAHESEKISIVCSVIYSKPPPRLKWFRKNTELLPEAAKTTVSKMLLSNRHTVYSVESNLVLYPRLDEEYKCQAEHPGLSKPLRATAQINIFKKPSNPVIEGYKIGDIVNFHEKLTLKCSSSNGYPPPSVIWLRNGVEIDRTYIQTSRYESVNSLSFVVEQNDNFAQYTCQVFNSLTSIPLQQTVTLNVLLFPTQIKIKAPNEVLLVEPQGTPVTLECTAYPASQSPNESKIRWLIDGKEVINDGEQGSHVHATKHEQKSWTIRSNLTFVINSKEPNVRNIACIAYSTNIKTETVSATHKISVIYPPELPTLFGVKDGIATVVAGEIFKCKCVCYSGNPKANLVWLNHQNQEISALTSNTGSGISSELVLRPTPSDHGSVFRCHVRHPALEKSYEVSFVLQIIFPPDHLNITFPKFSKENDTIKIECTTSPSNPCPTISLLKNGKKIDEDSNNVIIEKITNKRRLNWNNYDAMQKAKTDVNGDEFDYGDDYEDEQPTANIGNVDKSSIDATVSTSKHHRLPKQWQGSVGSTPNADCHTFHNGIGQHGHHSNIDNNYINASSSIVMPPRSVKVSVLMVARPEDDGSEITCIANSPLIPGHVIREDKIIRIYYKPKFNNYMNYIKLNENESYQHSVSVYANPSADNLVFSRVKETKLSTRDEEQQASHQQQTAASNDLTSAHSNHSLSLSLNDLIHSQTNISWLLEPIPADWSWSLSSDVIHLNMQNVTLSNAGLYIARVSNTLGDSMFFVRLVVKSTSTINSIKLYSSNPTSSSSSLSSFSFYSSLSSLSHLNESHNKILEGDKYFRIECEVIADPSIVVKWSKQNYLKHSTEQTMHKGNSFVNSQPNFLQHRDDRDNDSNNIDWSRTNYSQSNDQLGPSFPPSNNSHSIKAELIVTNVSFEDSGFYTCITPNDTKRIQVKIEHHPRILAELNSFKVATDSGTPFVKFVCSAIAYPIAYFNWTVKGNSMISQLNANVANDKYRLMTHGGIGTHHTITHSEMESYQFTSELIIRRVNEEDFRSYKCTAYNQMGSDQMTFELVRKSFPENPHNLQAINITHNSALLKWIPGFDYGHQQNFQIQVWRIDKSQHEQLLKNEQNDLLDSLASRTFLNISANYFLVPNLEPEIYYRICVFAYNRLGKSLKSNFLTIQTLSSQNSLLKPVYASADEQRLNGLIGNRIIGEDFFELSVILCLIFLVLVSLITSIFFYCRRRQRQDLQKRETDGLNSSCNNNKAEYSGKLMDSLTRDSNSRYLNSTEYSAHARNTLTPAASLSLSQTNANTTTTSNIHDISSDVCNNNSSLSTNSSYHLINDDYMQPVTTSFCQSINIGSAGDRFTLDSTDSNSSHSKYLSCGPNSKQLCPNYLTISSPSSTFDSSTIDNQNDAASILYPYELTGSFSEQPPTTKDGDNVDYDKLQFLLASHQQITNVHLLPEGLKNIDKSICLDRDSNSQQQQQQLANNYISLAPIQYNATSGSNLDDSANLCTLPLSSFDFGSQYSLDSRSNSASSPANVVHQSSSYMYIGNSGSVACDHHNLQPKPKCNKLGDNLLLNNSTHANVDVNQVTTEFNLCEISEGFTVNSNCSKSGQSLDCSALKHHHHHHQHQHQQPQQQQQQQQPQPKVIKRVNLIKPSNSSVPVILTTLNEEDEI